MCLLVAEVIIKCQVANLMIAMAWLLRPRCAQVPNKHFSNGLFERFCEMYTLFTSVSKSFRVKEQTVRINSKAIWIFGFWFENSCGSNEQ